LARSPRTLGPLRRSANRFQTYGRKIEGYETHDRDWGVRVARGAAARRCIRRGAKKGAKKRTRALRAVAFVNPGSASTSSGGFRALEGTALGGARQILNLPWDRGAS
jgi:hypothetical protein